ncbi:MAG: hypothetical protein ACFFDV_09680, partial [Candidatus Thorarchaeota archaeon]
EKTIEHGLWIDVNLQTDESMPPHFSREILSNKVSVKVTLDIPWAIDKSVFIPINLGHYVIGSDSDASDASDFNWD